MDFWNYCPNCGVRLKPNDGYCPNCNMNTIFKDNNVDYLFSPPVHNIGFFNFNIDFSPYINSSRKVFKYEICSCGYINKKDNDFCYMCGSKRNSRFWRKNKKPEFSLDNILCECGVINNEDNFYCESCGAKLKDTVVINKNQSNFNLEFEEHMFCFCGQENEIDSQFCKNCGLPLKSYGKYSNIHKLCVCSKINTLDSDFCMDCGRDLKKENRLIICVCGCKNEEGSSFCSNCSRPLNPEKVIKSKLICSCGNILSYSDKYCPACGKNIVLEEITLGRYIKSIKDRFWK